LSARLTGGSDYIFLASHEGMACRFEEGDVRAMGRSAAGVRGIKLDEGDYLIGMEVVGKEGLILSISENGYGKRTPLEDYRLTARGVKGVINMKTTPKVGKVVAILPVKEDSELMIITKQGQIIRIDSASIRQTGRSTSGVRLVNVEAGDQVAAASLIPETEGNGSNGQEELPLQ
jgi:DNA gyrase subunit A